MCLNAFEKEIITASFCNHDQSIDDLAYQYGRSRRTIIRVLEEMNVDPGIRRRKPKPPTKPVQAPLPLVIPTRSPWYRRILDRVIHPFQ
jgi:hypothetical protein